MSRFRISEEKRRATNGLDGVFVVIKDQETNARTEVWPALGFNCVSWQTSGKNGIVDRLYAAPDFLDDDRPTRSGFPILFPFPNRIRDGRYSWDGRDYQLPLNDPAKKNAIHGFACRNAWRIVDQGTSGDEAWLTGEFHASKDAPSTLELWPADHWIQVTYRITPEALQVDAIVSNPSDRVLPFGLGYHPYFKVVESDALVQVSAEKFWELNESLPTGRILGADENRNLTVPYSLSKLQLDDIFTRLGSIGDPQPDEFPAWATITNKRENHKLILSASNAFREMVVYSPPHRQAICLEPYTCTTDAINLQQRGIDAGLLMLDPAHQWSAGVRLIVRPLKTGK